MRNYLFLTIALIIFSNAASAATLTSNIDRNCSILTKKNYAPSLSKSTSILFTSPDTNKAPVIKAVGDQIYYPGTTLNIATDVTISDTNNKGTDAIHIQISSGYINGEDLLTLTNPEKHSTIIAIWNANEGKLKLSSPTLGKQIAYTEFIDAIKDVQYSNSSATTSGNRTFIITVCQANYLPSNGHFYEYIPNLEISWTSAKASAKAQKYYGLTGYLATVTTDNEAKFVGNLTSESAWIGGSDIATEGEWRWTTGPEGLADEGAGTVFWNGSSKGSTPNFAFWRNGEPNNSGNEDYAHITPLGLGIKGSWNDLADAGGRLGGLQKPKGYMVEYGGMPGDPILEITTSTTITLSKITNTTSYSRCDSGSITLIANTVPGKTIKWYDSEIEGTFLGIGNSYKTPILTTTTIYYIDNGISNNRTAITVNINKIPSIISTNTEISICSPSSVTLQANTTIGTVNWYATATGGMIEATGMIFTTPIITQNTTYYAEAVNTGCTNSPRTPFYIKINTPPTISATIPGSRCDTGSVTLEAVATDGIINWYNVPTGGTSLGNGSSFTTPSIATTTTYYVDATESNCTTNTRTAVTATVNTSPAISKTNPASRCETGSVTLEAVATAGIINWYNVPTGGTSLSTGTTFTTPNISTTTTYYVDATESNRTTNTRTAVTATVNTPPTITKTNPASRCDTGSVTLEAVATVGIINWYNVPTGGTSLGTGTTFTTPNITTTTTYYVEAIENSCTSPRIPLIVTVYPISILNEEVILCQNEKVTLDALIPEMNYLWSPGGETTKTIITSTIGDYNVTISYPFTTSSDLKKTIKVIEHTKPIIKNITVNENSIVIELAYQEKYFEFSINGEDFQESNQFSDIPNGQYTAIVRDKNGCNITTQDFNLFTIEKYFTPNNDGYNDVWEIKEMRDHPNSSAYIFNRYGKLITTLSALKNSWDGNYNNNNLPTDDYWYILKMEDSKPEIRGHFSLKR